jgi:FixJ family two-component response regulator
LTQASLIAIIDDDAPLRGAIDNLLRSSGFETILYSSAEAFLGDPVFARVNLVISDIKMPGMTGLDLQAQLIERKIDVPIILITAILDDATTARALGSGAAAFIRKPFDDSELIAAIYAAIQ